MNGLLHKTGLPARPSMILASAALHGLLLALCAIYSLWLLETRAPLEPASTRVRLSKYSLRMPEMDKVRSQLSVTEPSPGDTLEEVDVAPKSKETTRQTVQAKRVKTRSPGTIPLRKSRRRPKKVEDPKSGQPSTKKPGTPKPKENPDAYLQSRIAHLREQRSTMKPLPGTVSTTGSGPASPRTGQGSGQWDEDLVRWFRDVRSQVNAHWSVFGEEGPVKRVTVVGVRIGDDGELIDAKVDSSSGNETFDLSAIRAVRQAAPFPSMPNRLRDEIRRAGGLALRFTPGGMQ